MKIEKRGKYGGVKIHLDADECKEIMSAAFPQDLPVVDMTTGALINPEHFDSGTGTMIGVGAKLVCRLSKQIKDLMKEEPHLLDDRSEEEVIAILAKESEKARLQLDAAKHGKDWKKIDPSVLKDALLKHVKA